CSAAGLSSLHPCVSAKPTPSLAAEAKDAAMPRSSGLLRSERFWLASSGASHHITPDRSLLHDLQAVEQPSGRKLKALRSDNGTEYINHEARAILASQGIQHQRSAPYSPEQDGSAERLNRTLIEKGCRPLDNRWVLSVKEDSHGHIARYKARLVVKGFMQREGVDLTELHAPAEVEQLGFATSAADLSLFTMVRGNNKVLLAVYVDEGDDETMAWVKQRLAVVFDIHQLGSAERLLSMEIVRDRAARVLS
ncbi:hypothetical protein QJQ45_022200, partial [Haematococcus lacustris]